MSNFDRDPVSVASREVHGPSFGMGTLGLVAVLGLGAGTILGGVIMPFLRSGPPDQSQSQKLEAAQETNRALLFSMYPQTIYAPVIEGGAPVTTGMSVEQYLTELEVRGSQAGLSATKIVERKGDNVEISYAFSDKESDSTRTFPQSKIRMTHLKTLVLTFASGPLPGTIALLNAREDGRDRGAGASFVDFVSLGAMPPELGEGQFLTSRGVFEIKLSGDGVGAFLDGVLVYPAAPPRPGPTLAFPGTKPLEAPLTAVLPRRLALQSFQPAVGALKDRLILVASNSAADDCLAKAVILDAKRGTVTELPEALQVPAISVTNAKDALILNGFCVKEPVTNVVTAPSSPQSSPLPDGAVPKVEVRLSARYDLKTGALTWQRETIAIAPPAPIGTIDAGAQTGASTLWRTQSETRIASPLISGGALISVACRPGGGTTLALSGLPAPADGLATSVRFSSLGASAIAQMRWRASAGGYELDGAARPNEARAILDRLRGGGMMTISGAGSTKVVPAPGSAQIDRLVRSCNAVPAAVGAAASAIGAGAALAGAPTQRTATSAPTKSTQRATVPKAKPPASRPSAPRPPRPASATSPPKIAAKIAAKVAPKPNTNRTAGPKPPTQVRQTTPILPPTMPAAKPKPPPSAEVVAPRAE